MNSSEKQSTEAPKGTKDIDRCPLEPPKDSGSLEGMTHRQSVLFMERFYSKYPERFCKSPYFKIWQQRRAIIDGYERKYDTGLIVPKNIPLTTIVITAYDNIEDVYYCLDSIYSIESISPFEVIVVDDCSDCDYKALQCEFPQIKVIRNEERSGFFVSANRGVAEARGEYVLFLNSSAEVMAWWLDELTTALYNHPDAGMIGSQLINLESSKVQESGNRICKDCDILPLGKDEYPDHPLYSFFQEVDFCSSFSMIIRKKVFEEIGGFNENYATQCLGDADLGMRLKKAACKNYVVPGSRIISKTQTVRDNVNDWNLFSDLWRQYLQENAIYDNRNDSVNFKPVKEWILYIDAEYPMADRGSGGMDAIFFMEYMIKRGYHVVFHGEHTAGYDPKYTGILLRMGVECVYQPFRKIFEYVAHNGYKFSYLFISRIYQARHFDWLLKPYCPHAGYIFNTVDVHFVREMREADLRHDDIQRHQAAYTKQCELAVMSAVDATIVISSDEKKMLENEYDMPRVYHVPQARKIFGLAENTKRRGAVFIGSAHPPNMDGLRYFHDQVLPLLPEDFSLTIIGEALRMMIANDDQYKDLLDCPQFKFIGFVPELATILDHAKITIAPLRYGAGTKGKVASSMAHGVPCVSSSFGTEGTGMKHGENIMIADDPEEFALHILDLFKDPELWQRLSDGGIKFINDNYSYEAVEKMMDDLFADVKKRKQEKISNWSTFPTIG